jgi:hypothetical protein
LKDYIKRKELFGSQNVDVGRERNEQDIHAQIGLQRSTLKKLLYSSSILKNSQNPSLLSHQHIVTHKIPKNNSFGKSLKTFFFGDAHKETRKSEKETYR